jgi:hypothetical protein
MNTLILITAKALVSYGLSFCFLCLVLTLIVSIILFLYNEFKLEFGKHEDKDKKE